MDSCTPKNFHEKRRCRRRVDGEAAERSRGRTDDTAETRASAVIIRQSSGGGPQGTTELGHLKVPRARPTPGVWSGSSGCRPGMIDGTLDAAHLYWGPVHWTLGGHGSASVPIHRYRCNRVSTHDGRVERERRLLARCDQQDLDTAHLYWGPVHWTPGGHSSASVPVHRYCCNCVRATWRAEILK